MKYVLCCCKLQFGDFFCCCFYLDMRLIERKCDLRLYFSTIFPVPKILGQHKGYWLHCVDIND